MCVALLQNMVRACGLGTRVRFSPARRGGSACKDAPALRQGGNLCGRRRADGAGARAARGFAPRLRGDRQRAARGAVLSSRRGARCRRAGHKEHLCRAVLCDAARRVRARRAPLRRGRGGVRGGAAAGVCAGGLSAARARHRARTRYLRVALLSRSFGGGGLCRARRAVRGGSRLHALFAEGVEDPAFSRAAEAFLSYGEGEKGLFCACSLLRLALPRSPVLPAVRAAEAYGGDAFPSLLTLRRAMRAFWKRRNRAGTSCPILRGGVLRAAEVTGERAAALLKNIAVPTAAECRRRIQVFAEARGALVRAGESCCARSRRERGGCTPHTAGISARRTERKGRQGASRRCTSARRSCRRCFPFPPRSASSACLPTCRRAILPYDESCLRIESTEEELMQRGGRIGRGAPARARRAHRGLFAGHGRHRLRRRPPDRGDERDARRRPRGRAAHRVLHEQLLAQRRKL